MGQLGHWSKGTKKTKEKISWHKLPGLEAKFTQCPPTKDILSIWEGRETSSEEKESQGPSYSLVWVLGERKARLACSLRSRFFPYVYWSLHSKKLALDLFRREEQKTLEFFLNLSHSSLMSIKVPRTTTKYTYTNTHTMSYSICKKTDFFPFSLPKIRF